MEKIKKGDLVQVITGATEERGGYRGKQGHVLAVLTETNKVIVEGVNIVTKHVKAGQTEKGDRTGGIQTAEAPIHISNVALVDAASKGPTKVCFKVSVDKDGKKSKVRVAKKTGKEI